MAIVCGIVEPGELWGQGIWAAELCRNPWGSEFLDCM